MGHCGPVARTSIYKIVFTSLDREERAFVSELSSILAMIRHKFLSPDATHNAALKWN
jgi:hypothetical protein